MTHSENSQNQGIRINNKSGHKNIIKEIVGWRFHKNINGNRHSKRFNTLDEAIEYKINYLKELPQ